MKKVRHVAMKLAYDGSEFYGFQRQPGKATVEGSLIRALEAIGAIESARQCGFRSSSRTDRGVSALGNVASFQTDFSLRSLCSAVNSKLSGAWTYSAVRVDDDFNPRWARQRWYRYFLPAEDHGLAALRRAAKAFIGTHDFSHFARADGRSPLRTIDSITVTRRGSFFLIDFRAESFLWNMVRRVIWHIDAVSRGVIEDSSPVLGSGNRPRRTGLVPAENLLLMDVDCGIDFPHDQKAVKALHEELRQRMVAQTLMIEFTELFVDRLKTGHSR